MTGTVESLIAYCRENRRVCPQPTLWNELWEILPGRRRVGSGWEPPLPLILAAWHTTSALSKMLRLEEHIRWAEENGALETVAAFVHGLPEEDWNHIGEWPSSG